MRGVNKAMVVGYVGAEPDVRTTKGGVRVARVSVATHEYYTDKETGERRKVTDWHRVVAFAGRAKLVEERVSKGDAVCVLGRMKRRKWRDEKNGVDRWTTEVMADEIDLIGQTEKAPASSQPEDSAPEDSVPAEIDDDDLPF